jgi:multicomponent Na+:H+ antiporter subunit B
MTIRLRLVLFGLAAAGLAAFFVAGVLQLHPFGSHTHPYRDIAIQAATKHATANVVGSVTYDQRGIDTLIEETIMLASVVGAAALLRPAKDEEERRVPDTGSILPSTQLVGYLLLPITLLVGIDLAAHGHVTPGGGFQAGVVMATAVHLLYVAGSFRAVERIRPLAIHQLLEGIGAAGFVCLGLAGLVSSSAFLGNVLDTGTFAQLFSGGTVPVLNGIVAVEIAASVVVLVGSFLDQEVVVRKDQHDGE